jgi:hypothetical protein
MLRVALIELRRLYAEQFIRRNTKRTSQGNECRSGWELRFRFVIGDRALVIRLRLSANGRTSTRSSRRNSSGGMNAADCPAP